MRTSTSWYVSVATLVIVAGFEVACTPVPSHEALPKANAAAASLAQAESYKWSDGCTEVLAGHVANKEKGPFYTNPQGEGMVFEQQNHKYRLYKPTRVQDPDGTLNIVTIVDHQNGLAFDDHAVLKVVLSPNAEPSWDMEVKLNDLPPIKGDGKLVDAINKITDGINKLQNMSAGRMLYPHVIDAVAKNIIEIARHANCH